MGILFGACLGFPVARTNTFPESLTCLELDFLLPAARKHPTGYPSRRCVGNTVLSLLCLGSPIKVSEKSHNSLLTFVQGRVCQLYLTEETFFPQYLINIWQDTCVPKPTLLKGMPWIPPHSSTAPPTPGALTHRLPSEARQDPHVFLFDGGD